MTMEVAGIGKPVLLAVALRRPVLGHADTPPTPENTATGRWKPLGSRKLSLAAPSGRALTLAFTRCEATGPGAPTTVTGWTTTPAFNPLDPGP